MAKNKLPLISVLVKMMMLLATERELLSDTCTVVLTKTRNARKSPPTLVLLTLTEQFVMERALLKDTSTVDAVRTWCLQKSSAFTSLTRMELSVTENVLLLRMRAVAAYTTNTSLNPPVIALLT